MTLQLRYYTGIPIKIPPMMRDYFAVELRGRPRSKVGVLLKDAEVSRKRLEATETSRF